MSYTAEFEKWINSPYLDDASKQELLAIREDETEKELRFLGYLTFGTGGLRGTMGAGINKMNVYTVAHATQGMAEMIKLEGGNAAERGVVIAYDSRNNSPLFASTAASVLSANGIKAYLFDGVRPNFRLRSVTSAVSRVSTLPLRTTRRNTTDIRRIGRTAHSFPRSMQTSFPQRLKRSISSPA